MKLFAKIKGERGSKTILFTTVWLDRKAYSADEVRESALTNSYSTINDVYA